MKNAIEVAKEKNGKNPKVLAGNPENTAVNRVVRSSNGLKIKKGIKTQETQTPCIGAYIRVSTVGQNEAGQRAEVERWLRCNGFKPESLQWYVDKRSGDDFNRPGFDQLQRAVFNGEINTIVVYKLDRLSRSLCEGLNVIARWCDHGIRVVAVTQQIDFNGTVGKMIAAVLLGIAEMEQENRRERQAAGIAEAKRRGVYKGRKAGTFKANPVRAKELYNKGLTVAEVANALGVSTVTVSHYLKLWKKRISEDVFNEKVKKANATKEEETAYAT